MGVDGASDDQRYTIDREKMIIRFSNKKKMTEVTISQIEDSLREFAKSSEGYIIIEENRKNYIQITLGNKKAYIIEYQKGGANKHYNCVDKIYDINSVVQIVKSFISNGPELKKYKWKKIELDDPEWITISNQIGFGIFIITILFILSQRLFHDQLTELFAKYSFDSMRFMLTLVSICMVLMYPMAIRDMLHQRFTSSYFRLQTYGMLIFTPIFLIFVVLEYISRIGI